MSSKERIRKTLQRAISDTHKEFNDQKKRHRINIVHSDSLRMFSKAELEGMGYIVRDMPVLNEEG